ncbi:MAG: hypothetical protein SOV59_09390 [Fusobacterium mortiferum]|nr:hypothetical protein [Fusobacterium mortiferum]
MIKKENLIKECENYLANRDIEKFKEEMGIVEEGKIVPDEDLAKVDENGNVIEE